MQIPSTLFETLQSALKQETKRICRDAARILHIPQKELEEKIIKNCLKIPITVISDKDIPTSCPAILQGDILYRCRHPCILGTGRCHAHQTVTIPEIDTRQPEQITLTRIRYTAQELWCEESTGTVYNNKKENVGEYRNNRLYLISSTTVS